MRLTASLAIVVALGIASSGARAANKPPAHKAQEKAAQEACLLGDYQKGSERRRHRRHGWGGRIIGSRRGGSGRRCAPIGHGTHQAGRQLT